jgi:uncharacterized protein (DUF362 family)
MAHAADLADNIMRLPTLDHKSLRNTIEAHMSIYSMDLSKKKIKNLENTLDQLKANLAATDDPQQRVTIRAKMTEIEKEISKNSVIVTENKRLNSYKRLRQMLKDRGYEDLLDEFDRETVKMFDKEEITNTSICD